MTIALEPWELARAQRFVADSNKIITEGTSGAESLPALLTSKQVSNLDESSLRRAAYGLFPALGVVAPWTGVSFSNSWANDAAGAPCSVMKDPFGFVHWRGHATRTTGSAVSGEELCRVPVEFAPPVTLGFACITNSGLIHLAIVPGVAYASVIWQTTGGFSGGFGAVFLENIVPYDTRS